MKKIVLFSVIILSFTSCQKDKKAEVKESLTAYIDTSVLMKEYLAAQDVQAKYKQKAEEKGKLLETEINRFKRDAADFEKNAQINGQSWAQQKASELQRREMQLRDAQQSLAQKLQEESSVEMDTLISNVKKFIKDFGKKGGYSYIYGTGDAATVLYAKDQFNVTKEVLKQLNENYKQPSEKKAKK